MKQLLLAWAKYEQAPAFDTLKVSVNEEHGSLSLAIAIGLWCDRRRRQRRPQTVFQRLDRIVSATDVDLHLLTADSAAGAESHERTGRT